MGVALRYLRPKWLAEPGREHMGLELDCPSHPDAPHRLRIWFENPGDGGPPSPSAHPPRLAWLASACDFDELTVVPSGTAPYRPLEVGHWSGWLIEGEISEARIVGIG